MTNRLVVSVVIPTHNREQMVVRAVQSALAQTYKPLEVLVVDDGSADNTQAVLAAYPAIKVVSLPTNRGGAFARNTGIRLSSGDFVAFLDSDDEWLPQKIERQMAVILSDERVGAVYSRHYGHDDRTGRRIERHPALHRGEVLPYLLAGWCPHTVSLFLTRRRALAEVGFFDEELRGFQDTDLWLRMASRGWLFDAVDEPLTVVHSHSGPRVTLDKERRLLAVEQFLDRWGEAMSGQIGSEGIRRFRSRHTAVVLGNQLLAEIEAGRRREAVSLLRRYIGEAGFGQPRQLLGLLLALVLGTRTHRAIKGRLERQ